PPFWHFKSVPSSPLPPSPSRTPSVQHCASYCSADHVEWRVVRSFGISSAVGGLAGAVLQTVASSRALELVFGTLLILAGTSELTGWMQRVHWGRTAAWVAW
ncbi:MAG TPA: sulfite exporter TauE/SafE family protein, partial [Gemmatimonadales bacterium]|nr:sulfite exporter TauE/SafE family protein [Gemmatimonadales bacterium]